MSSGDSQKINVTFGGILPPPQLLHALERGNPHLAPNKFISLCAKTVYASISLDRKTLKKIDGGIEVSKRTWNKLLSGPELKKAKGRMESNVDFEAGASTMAWYGFVTGYHNSLPLTKTLKFINEGIRQEITIQAGKHCLADAIEDWSAVATEKRYFSKRVVQSLLRLQSYDSEQKNDRLGLDFLSSDIGHLFMKEIFVSSTIAFLLRYELDLEAEYCPPQTHSKNKYLSLYFKNESTN